MAPHVKRTMTGLEDIRPMQPDGALARTMRAGRYWEKRARAAERVRRLDMAATVAATVAGVVATPVTGALIWLGWTLWQWFAP